MGQRDLAGGNAAASGMVAAVATAPGLHAPSEWMPRALGEYTCESTRELEAVTGDWLSLYTAVLEALQDGKAEACCPGRLQLWPS